MWGSWKGLLIQYDGPFDTEISARVKVHRQRVEPGARLHVAGQTRGQLRQVSTTRDCLFLKIPPSLSEPVAVMPRYPVVLVADDEKSEGKGDRVTDVQWGITLFVKLFFSGGFGVTSLRPESKYAACRDPDRRRMVMVVPTYRQHGRWTIEQTYRRNMKGIDRWECLVPRVQGTSNINACIIIVRFKSAVIVSCVAVWDRLHVV